MATKLTDCNGCLKKAGRSWDNVAFADQQEGICPKHTEKEIYVCELTGKRLPQLGRMHIIGCR